MIWRAFLRWLGRRFTTNRKADAVEVKKGMDAILKTEEKPATQSPTMPQAEVNAEFKKKVERIHPHQFGKQ